MNCLTEEQLAEVALRRVDDERVRTHVAECEACRAKLAETRRLVGQLAAAHLKLASSHEAGRARLLASLRATDTPPRRAGAWNGLTRALAGLTFGQRVAAGGASLSTAIGILLVLFFANSAGRLSAMERMLASVREVKSYSYRMTVKTTFPANDQGDHSVRQQDDVTYWRAPAASEKQWLGDLYSETKMWRFDERDGTPVYHHQEIYPSGKPGMIILYKHRMGAEYYRRTPPLTASDIPDFSPIAKLLAVRDESGRVLRALGAREIDGKAARGYVATFKDSAPFKYCGEVEVWVEAETDLPLGFSFQQEHDGILNEYQITDCRWNIELDPELFVPRPPEGFTDTTPPDNDEDIAKIAAALKLYARLSGGNYPRATEFDDEELRKEMLKFAGFTGEPRDEWKNDAKFVEIQNDGAGLNWIARILRNRVHVDYYGATVGPEDKDKVLLWWLPVTTPPDSLFRVFYGDLRTEVLPYAEWSKLVPEEAAAAFRPE